MHDPDSNYGQNYFVALYCFVGFNLSDWVGRSLAGWRQVPSQQRYRSVVYPILARFVFIPLFVFCNLSKDTWVSVVFSSLL
jgi:equilibrative nucleoside transporter 1/2/3